MNYAEMQNIAKTTIEYIKSSIYSGMLLTEVRDICERKMIELGADSFWYWNVGAFVFSGEETSISISGRDYVTSERAIAENDIITIDLSPQKDNIWGDYARTIVVENGVVVETADIHTEEWKNGLFMEEYLHDVMRKFVTPKTTFEELYYHLNSIIIEKGYLNLDFLGNLGHSIAKRKEDRIYIEKGNTVCLGDVSYFTFEPHISVQGSKYGHKKENIYYFENGKLKEL